MKTLKHYHSLLSIRSANVVQEKRLQPKRSFASFLAPNRSPPYGSTYPSTPALSSASSSSSTIDPEPQPAFRPPHSTSEFRWQYQRKMWWRKVDSMANFILHWQERFHQNGDMFVSCTLDVSSPSASTSTTTPCTLSHPQLREAVRRFRFDHPTVALRLAKRSAEGIEPLRDIPELIAASVDLQVALVYDVVESEPEVERWLDDVVVYHDERVEEDEFGSFVRTATADGVPGRDRLRIHFFPATASAAARLLIEQSHSVSEGIGSLHVFDLLVSSVASVLTDPAPRSLQWGSEVSRLEPALQDAIASPPPTWDVSPEERKKVAQINAERMNGKASPPNFADRLGTKVVSLALTAHERRSPLSGPLVTLCRSVAEKGEMLPLGVLPQTGVPFDGKVSHTGMITDTLTAEQMGTLLRVLKGRGATLAPFIEACMHMATTWVRETRGFAGKDDGDKILGSFSNAISKRDTLLPQYRRYLGLCMSGFPTKIAAGTAMWSSTSSMRSPTDPLDRLPSIEPAHLTQLFSITSALATQYTAGRNNPNWLRHDQALLFSTMLTEYLFLRDRAHYPSMPWLSSIGKVENLTRPSHALAAGALDVHNLQVVGRVGVRQPILHVYTFRGQTRLQLSFADWYYNAPDSDARKCYKTNEQRQNILTLWMQVVRSLIDAVIQAEA